MSDSERLHGKITRLSDDIGVTGTGRRIVSADDPDALLALVLREVEETVLQRCLVLETGSHSSARVEVAAGRVLGIETARETLSGSGGFADIAEFASAIAAALSDFVGSESKLLVRSERSPFRPGPADLRCPTEPIAARLWPDTAGAQALQTFARALSDHAVAWWLSDSDSAPGASAGPVDRVASLADFFEAHLAEIDAQLDRALGSATRSGCLLLGATASDGDSLIWARSGGVHLLVLIHASGEPELTQHWSGIFGG